MNVTRSMVIAGCLLLVGSALPIGAAHLAQNPSASGSATSFGFGGPLDPDPCRRESNQDALANPADGNVQGPPSELPTRSGCPSNNGVSGTYVGSTSITAVECLGNLDTAPASPNGTHANCDSLIFTTGWGALGAALCDLEVGILDGTGLVPGGNPDDETFVDNTAEPGGAVPDGTWDDGGFGGACHVSTYGGSNPNNNANTNPPNTNNNAFTECEGTAYAEDKVLGADVPIFVACDFAEFVASPFPPPALVPGLVNCAIASKPIPDRVQCAQNNLTKGIDQILNPPPGGFASCTRDASSDVAKLGKGGGHIGDGVTVPNVAHMRNDTLRQAVKGNCTADIDGDGTVGAQEVPGDIVIFVSNLVSANPFGQAYLDEHDPSHDSGVDEGFGWPGVDSDAQALSDWNNDGYFDGTGDTIVYPATWGWTDHYFDRFTSQNDNCHAHDGHTSSHNHGPTGLSQDDHLTPDPSPTNHNPDDCGETSPDKSKGKA